jgi:hypothetical protein
MTPAAAKSVTKLHEYVHGVDGKTPTVWWLMYLLCLRSFCLFCLWSHFLIFSSFKFDNVFLAASLGSFWASVYATGVQSTSTQSSCMICTLIIVLF